SLLQIGRGLEADGILTGAGKTKWRPETLKKILQNEKYIGDALLQKTYTVDFLNKKRVQNKGIVPQYYVENSHEPIIPRDLYMQVQEEMIRVVKRIYREYLEGASLFQIGRGLEADGILTGAGKTKWRPETLKKILQNEKYIGDAHLYTTRRSSDLNKKRVQNKGIVPQYYVENSHEPIIPRDLYMQVQEEMIRRADLHSGANRKKRVYSSKYALSSIVYCSKCGEIYRRIAWNNRGKHSTVWRCCTRVEHGPTACDAPTIQEPDLQAAVVQAINFTLGNREGMMATLQENVEAVVRQEDETSSRSEERRVGKEGRMGRCAGGA